LICDGCTLTIDRAPEGKFKVRSGTAVIDTTILADQVLELRIPQGQVHVGDAFVQEADELRERRVRTTGTARQRRNEASQRREGMAVDRPKIDGLRRAPGRTAHPQEPMPCLERATDRRRDSIGMRLACRSFHTAMRRPASSRIWASVARFAAASFSADAARCASILRRLNPAPVMVWARQCLTLRARCPTLSPQCAAKRTLTACHQDGTRVRLHLSFKRLPRFQRS
jgi:hypothetical protein